MPGFSSVTENYEVLCVQQHDVLFSVLDRPPSGNTEQFKSFVECLLDYAFYKKLRWFLGGDFNINLLGDSTCSNDMIHRIIACGFKNVIQTPTRITVTSYSILDLLITNYDTPVTAAGTINCDLSVHCPVFLPYSECASRRKPIAPMITYQSIPDCGLEKFRNGILFSNWRPVMNSTNADDAYNSFMTIFTKHYNTCFPMKTFKPPRRVRNPGSVLN